MESRLLDAARNGDVRILHKLIEEDWRILHTIALSGGETPLHTACLAGHLHFVQEIIKLKPDFAWELNSDGFSPLHIASAKGYVEIASELLRIDPNLCLIEGTEKRIPLHNAVIKGRVEVVKELLATNTDMVDSVTARGETALHVAVKNSQFTEFLVLVEHLKQVNKEDVLNMKDDQGNTVLHLAVYKKQYQVVDLLLNGQVVPKEATDLNSLNKRGLAPIDVLHLFQSEAGDREIENILRRSGAKMAEELLAPPINVANASHQNEVIINPTNGNSSNPQSRRVLTSQESTEINTLLVVFILIATATYQAVLSPPGGVWQDDGNPKHIPGTAVMGTRYPVTFGSFMILNTIGFVMSITMIQILVYGFSRKFELFIACVALITSYDLCMQAIAPSDALLNLFVVISFILPIPLYFAIKVSTCCSNRRMRRRNRQASSGNNQQIA